MSKYKHLIIFGLLVTLLGIVVGDSAFAEGFYSSISVEPEIVLDVSAVGTRANVVKSDVEVISTCPAGYEVYITGPSDSNLYKDGNKSSESKIRSSSSSPTPIVGDIYYGTWGFATEELNDGNPVTYESDFIGLANGGMFEVYLSEEASGDGSRDPETGKDVIPVYYGASVTESTPSGTYKMAESYTGAKDNVITYSLVPHIRCITYSVRFIPASYVNGEMVVGDGTMQPQTIYEGISTPLSLNEFTPPEGYEFYGWNTAQDGSGTYYADGADVVNLANVMDVANLYAMWQKKGPITLERAYEMSEASKYKGYYRMQDMKSSICEATEVYADEKDMYTGEIAAVDQLQVIDSRDDKLYWIVKLRDNNCWMAQNLDLNLDIANLLSSDDTDLTQYGVGGYTIENGYKEIDDVIYWAPAKSTFDAADGDFTTWSGDYQPKFGQANTTQQAIGQVNPQSWDVGDWFYDGTSSSSTVCDYLTSGCSDFSQVPFSETGTHGAVGNYYNWNAAVASNDTSSYIVHISSTDDIPDAPKNSICPRGWRLPGYDGEYYDDTEYNYLGEIYSYYYDGNFNFKTMPTYYEPTGAVYGLMVGGTTYPGQLNNPGRNVSYWTNRLDYDSSRMIVRPKNAVLDYSRYTAPTYKFSHQSYGFPVRCVAR